VKCKVKVNDKRGSNVWRKAPSCPPISSYFPARGRYLWKPRDTRYDFSSRKREQYPFTLTIIGQDGGQDISPVAFSRWHADSVARTYATAGRVSSTCCSSRRGSSLYQYIEQDTSLRYEAWNRASKRLAEPHLSRAGGDLWRRARTIMEISLRARGGKGGIRGWNSGAYLSPERSAPPSPGYWFPRRSFYFKTVPLLFLIKR